MAPDTATASSLQGQTFQAASLHAAAWPDMLTNLHVAYADLTRTQLELEQQATEIDEARELFERVIESMSEALFLMDTTGRIVRVNGAATALLERQGEALLGQPFAAVCTTTAIPSTPWQLLARAPNGVLPHMDLELCTPAGHAIPVSLSCGLVRDQRGKITGVLVIARDITARKRAEEERQELHRQLVEASRRAGMADVAASVLHNVGNVLNSVNVTVQLIVNTIRKSPGGDIGRIATLLHEHEHVLGDYLRQDPKGQQIPGYLAKLGTYLAQEQTLLLSELDTLNRNIEHIKHIVSMQQSLAGLSSLHEPVRLIELMEQALTINRVTLQDHQIKVVREYDALPPVLVDRHQVLQILVNLINNAKDAMLACSGRQHQLTLRISVVEGQEGCVRLQVCDSGIGITPEHHACLFTQGFTTKKDGHGLGLHSSILAARMMGGTLSAHSDGAGQGATFTLDLPAQFLETSL
jgi:PAS domain S-box-containing protein